MGKDNKIPLPGPTPENEGKTIPNYSKNEENSQKPVRGSDQVEVIPWTGQQAQAWSAAARQVSVEGQASFPTFESESVLET